MTRPTNALFAKIAKNNLIVDQTIDALVEFACDQDGKASDTHKRELGKTSLLLFLASLIQGDKESGEDGKVD